MNEINKFYLIPTNLEGCRLDLALSYLLPEYSRSQIQNWIRQGFVKVDSQTQQRPNSKAIAGQTIIIQAQLSDNENWQAQAIPLDIIYSDDSLLVINKPVGLVVHPGAGQLDQTLVNALVHYDPALAALPRAGLVHRLDKETSGIMIIARNPTSYQLLVKAMSERRIIREYVAIVNGVMTASGKVDAPIGRHPKLRTKMAVVRTGRTAVTHYQILQRFHAHTSLQLRLETGRTHQIRVHMQHINYPIVGDAVYGKKIHFSTHLPLALRQELEAFSRQALHAKKLTLDHPVTNMSMSWEAPLPEDMQILLNQLQSTSTDHFAQE